MLQQLALNVHIKPDKQNTVSMLQVSQEGKQNTLSVFLVPASAPRLVYQMPWCNPICGMVHIKEPLLLIDKSSLCLVAYVAAAGFLSHYQNGP